MRIYFCLAVLIIVAACGSRSEFPIEATIDERESGRRGGSA